ncbi:alanine--tRNA ligase [Chloroflexota bacterium]
MLSNEIRDAYLKFFEEKGHRIIASSSLIPRDDPTLLLTTAGMVQIKPYFLGLQTPPKPRLTSCQKCFRTTDVESVGDYFKKEAINWGWEFVTQRLKLPAERIHTTVFLDDNEAYGIWRSIGVPESRIWRFGEESNFWGPAGDSGPCGPCSELIYDFGEDVGCRTPECNPSCSCGRFSEIWNLVFTQYNQDEAGKRTPLAKPNIDTGMGLERVAAILQGSTVYDTDLFIPRIKRVSELSGKKYGSDVETDRAMRIVAEHSRGIPFLIADGVIPGNEGRGYVLRRLLRRAALFGKRMGLEKLFLTEMAKFTIGQMGQIYPELVSRQVFILKVVEQEESRFRETLNTGLELLDDIIEKLKGKREKVVSGTQAFTLYDTYGFPIDLTREIAGNQDFSVDIEGFEEEMSQQRERARASQKFGGGKTAGQSDIKLDIEETPFVGYETLKSKSVVIALLSDGKPPDVLQGGQEATLILENTPFYGEMGGQLGDTGEILSQSGQFTVTNTVRIPPDIIAHQGKMAGGSLSVGDEVEAVVDTGRRLDITRNHTSTHLLQMALRKILGEHVQQRGSVVAHDHFRFDFSHLTTLTRDEIDKVQRLVNEKIRENLPVHSIQLPYKKAIEAGVTALFDEKYGDIVRVLNIGIPPVSAELCGGTHVNATGEIGLFRITSESSIGSGLRRIEAVTGRGAETYIEKHLAGLGEIAGMLETELDDVPAKVQQLSEEIKAERRQKLVLESELSRRIAESLLTQVEQVNGINVLATAVPSSRIKALRDMSDIIREKLQSVVMVLATVNDNRPLFLGAVTPDLVAKGFNAGDIVKQVAKVTGGGGGGKADLAQAGGKDKSKMAEGLQLVKRLVQEKAK